jgi:hypothetical protein
MISMAVLTPFFDVVAGVAILAGRSSLLDKGVFKTANTNFTVRHLLALGFIGYGGWNLWKIERAQDKLKKTLDAESFGAENCEYCNHSMIFDEYAGLVCSMECEADSQWPNLPKGWPNHAESFEADEKVGFQVYAFINDDDNEWGDPIGQPMPEKSYLSGSDEFHYIGFDSIEECKKYIKNLPKGWSGNIEVIVYDEEDFSKVRPEVISYEEYQNNMGAESFGADMTQEDWEKQEMLRLNTVLGNMEKALDIDSSDYTDLLNPHPIVCARDAIGKIEQEFGVNERDFDKGGEYDYYFTESFSADENKGYCVYCGEGSQIGIGGDYLPSCGKYVCTDIGDCYTDHLERCGVCAEIENKNWNNPNFFIWDYKKDAESFGAESCQHEWRKVNYGQHPKRFSHLWLCEKCNAQIDSINMPSENRKVRPNSYTRNWKMPKQSHYFGAEPFGAE